MKKVILPVLCLLLALQPFSAPAAMPGETAEVSFSMLTNPGKAFGVVRALEYDHGALELEPNFIFFGDRKIAQFNENLAAVFRVREGAKPGSYPVVIRVIEASDFEAGMIPEQDLPTYSGAVVTVERPPAEVTVYYCDAATGKPIKAEVIALPAGWTGMVTGNAPEGWAVTGGQGIEVSVSEDGQAMPPVVTFWLAAPTPAPTAAPTPTPAPTATPTPTPAPTAAPTPTPAPTATPTPTPAPTAAPTPTPAPTAAPTPTLSPTVTPTPSPTPPPTAPRPVSNLRVTERDRRSITLTWDGPEYAGPYKVEVRKSGADTWEFGKTVYNAKAEIGLLPDMTYDIRVTSVSGPFYGRGAALSGQKTAAGAYSGRNTSGDYVYALTDNGDAVITGYNGNGGEVTIPANIDGHPVISIDNRAFSGCVGLNSVTIPEGVTNIGYSAFSGCVGLNSVTIPESVTGIGYGAFSGCGGLNSVTIPEGVTVIGDFAFYGCVGLTSVTIPESVTGIGEQAFGYCTGLTSVTIPEGVTEIGNQAFYGCESLTSVTIPDSVTGIGENPWPRCYALTTINISPDHPSFSMIDGALYGRADNRLIWVPSAKAGSFNIRQGTRIIGDYALDGCREVTSVAIPYGVTYIGAQAFAFNGLASVTIPDSVIYIGSDAFSNSDHLTSVTIPGSVRYIGDRAFGRIEDLASVTLENGEIWLGDNPWEACPRLTTINVTPEHPTLFVSGGALYSKPDKRLVCVPGGTAGDLVIPQGIVIIGELAADECVSLTSVTVPNSVTSVEFRAFSDCAGLTSVTIPAEVTNINWRAFDNCPNLVLTVTRGSYAEEYCLSNGLPYRYAGDR